MLEQTVEELADAQMRAGAWSVVIDAHGAISSLVADGIELVAPDLRESWVRIEVGGRRHVLDRPHEHHSEANSATFAYDLRPSVPLRIEVTYRLVPLGPDGAAIATTVRLDPLEPIGQDVCVRVPANLRLPMPRVLFAPRKDGAAVRQDLSEPFDWRRPRLDWMYRLAGRPRRFMGPGPEELAIPLLSESSPASSWRITWCSDPYMTTRFVPNRPGTNGELDVVYDGVVGLREPESRTWWACLHPGDERAAMDAFYATALADVPPGPAWLREIAWVHYDFLADGGEGWRRDVDRLVQILPPEDLKRVFMCLHGWYDWLGVYAYDHATRSLRPRWDAVRLDHPDQTRPAPDDVFELLPIGPAEVRGLLRYARDRGIRVGLYFGDGLAADGGELGRTWADDEILEIGGYEAGRGPTAQLNPLHPLVRERTLGYLDALLASFGDDLDAFVWDETYYVDPGQLGPAACPGYADRAFMQLVHDLTANTHAYRPDIAFLASDCIGPPGFEHKAPYALVADGCFQDTGCRPDAWPYGTFPNDRNVLWSCNWYPRENLRLTAYGVQQFGAPVATANGFVESRGPGDYADDELRPLLDLFAVAKGWTGKPRRWLTEEEAGRIREEWPT